MAEHKLQEVPLRKWVVAQLKATEAEEQVVQAESTEEQAKQVPPLT